MDRTGSTPRALFALAALVATGSGCRGAGTDAGAPPGSDAVTSSDALAATDSAAGDSGADAGAPPADASGADSAAAGDSGTAPGTDAAVPLASRWGFVMAADSVTVAGAEQSSFMALFLDAATTPIPPSFFPGVPVAGAPGCELSSSIPAVGVDAGAITLLGLTVSPYALTATAPDFFYLEIEPGVSIFTAGVDWSITGGSASVPAFTGTDASPDPLVILTSVYDPATHTFTATWTPGNGTVVRLSVTASSGDTYGCVADDLAGTGSLPEAVLSLVTPFGTAPGTVTITRRRIAEQGDRFVAGSTVFFQVGSRSLSVAP